VLGPANKGKKCLVLDLDETLVHSSFQKVSGAHMTIPVTIEDTVHNVFVIKRPGVDEFMRRMGQHFEIVIYTASLSKYADPLLDKLDIHKVINKRLFRENCVFYEGHYVKDLSLLERDISQTIIVDNSPPSYTFHPENAIDCSSFIDDPADVEMWQIGDFLEGIKDCEDVRQFCRYVLTRAEILTIYHFTLSIYRSSWVLTSSLSLSPSISLRAQVLEGVGESPPDLCPVINANRHIDVSFTYGARHSLFMKHDTPRFHSHQPPLLHIDVPMCRLPHLCRIDIKEDILVVDFVSLVLM
jgi:RNA polymerase II subunit A small phosphatase-like protein